ncbi:MAG: TrmB family transcriptional regulator [Desulfobacterales bacterium]|nr:TrmB family transcriptional regulator [Desulfobacterales bacterium]
MDNISSLKELGFTQYEAACYMALISKHPVNGSKLSKISGIARSRIYDVLRSMISKGYVLETESSQYAPFPPDELIKKLNLEFKQKITTFGKEVKKALQEPVYEYIWTLTGYDNIMQKAKEMIENAKKEIYARLFSKSNNYLEKYLKQADKRGVNIRYIAMGDVSVDFDVQVIHPEKNLLIEKIGGRSFDIITDKKESLAGIFDPEDEDASPISWTRNKWFVTANRDSLRHDFYHYFLTKTYDDNKELTQKEKKIYRIIKKDD